MPGTDLGGQLGWLRSVLDLLPFPAQLIEPGTARILFVNEAARVLPFAPSGRDGVEGDPFVTDVEGDTIPPEGWPHRRAARGERLVGEQVAWHSPAGRSYFAVSSGPVPAIPDQPPLVLLTYLDVGRLRATQEELREAVRVRDEFFSFATHELKDPLASLLLSVEVLRRVADKHGTVPPELLRQRLDVSKRQGERLARMIENMLDVSRIKGGRLQVQAEVFDLRDLAGEVVGQFRDQARDAGVAIELEPGGPAVGCFDRVQLAHALGNLLSNALKYGAGRPVTVRVSADGRAARLEVEDRGIGVDPADHARIFERFERATDGHREKSLGLGLSIVKAVAEAHGGSIRLASEPGRGSTFLLELPREAGHDDAPTGDRPAGGTC